MENLQQEPWTEEEWKAYVDRVVAEGDPEPEPAIPWEWIDVPYPLNIMQREEQA